MMNNSGMTMALSDAARGLQGMTPPNVGMTNQQAGAYAMPNMVTAGQLEDQMTLASQQVNQDMLTAAPQASAAARGAAIAAGAEMDQPAYQAQQMLFERVANTIDATTGGGALMQYNAMLQSIGKDQARNNMLTQAAMRTGQAPEIGAEAAQAMQYLPM